MVWHWVSWIFFIIIFLNSWKSPPSRNFSCPQVRQAASSSPESDSCVSWWGLCWLYALSQQQEVAVGPSLGVVQAVGA